MKYFLTFFFTVFLSFILRSQTCSLQFSGIVSDVDTKQPLEGATIKIKELGKVLFSDSKGFYFIDSLCKGNYTLLVTHVDCLPIEIKFRLESNMVRYIEMPHTYNQLQEIVIQSNIERQAEAIKTVLSKSDVQQTRGMTLGEVLKKADGVSVLQTGSTIYKPVIHGLHSQRVLILNNGVRQEGQQWGSEHAPEIDPFIADRFTILKGAGALRYGADAIGGAILVEPMPLPRKTGITGELNTVMFSNNRMGVIHLMLQENLKKHPSWSWRTNVTLKKGGNTRTPDYWLYNTGVQELNYAAHLGYKKNKVKSDLFFSMFSTKLGIFWGSHVGNLTDLQNAINASIPQLNIDKFSYDIGRPRQEASHYLLKATYNKELKNGDKLNLLISQQENFRSEFDRALISSAPELDLNIGTTNVDLNYEQNTTGISQTSLGVVGQRQDNVWAGTRFFIPNFNSLMLGAYAIEKWALNKMNIEAGLRYDYRTLRVFRNQNNIITQSERNFNNISGTLALQYNVNEHLQWLLNGALAWRPPTVNELYVNGLHHGTANFEIGNPLLESEVAWKFSNQFKYKKDSSFSFDLTLYSNYVANFINLVPSFPPTLTLRGAYPTFRFIQTDALISGSDLSISYMASPRINLHARASLLFPYNLRAKTWLQQMPAQRANAEIVWYLPSDHPKQTSVQLGFSWVGQQRLVPADQKDYLEPPQGYLLTNLEYATLLHILKKHINFALSIYNLFNIQYRDYMNRFRYYNDEAGRNIVMRIKIPIRS